MTAIRRYLLLVIATCFCSMATMAQHRVLKHAHNDYMNPHPFYDAFELGYESIEADIFLEKGNLLIGHTKDELMDDWTLKNFYLDPILKEIQQNKGHLKHPIQLLIDLKTGGNTLDSLVLLLKPYQKVLRKAKLSITVSGEMPQPVQFKQYPTFMSFDGRFGINYGKKELKRIALYSISLQDVVKWNGQRPLEPNELESIKKYVNQAHSKGKKLRFWASADNPLCWQTLKNLGVDYIGTDQLQALADYLKK